MNKTETVVLGTAIFAVLAAYALIVVPREERRDAERREEIQPSKYLSTPQIFISHCGNPPKSSGGVLDYGTVLVSFRPAADGLAAHFYESDGVTEIAGEIGLKRLGCTL